ncbi:cupin domain-containing protein [Hyphomicrobium zavarzinii]|jgi:quercetin dioxygenase-like cupin family protein|uniref:cupin domain-containing protein n=1 Tax=Hyphomicrobium zavarzinii TaxID=48292 RepID=UPI00036E49F9|nr:cupin domain-containing protein [Hyphomicrobium zavarzinii]HML44526.1 cupin domain-containing protein [Hyphomicrobium zavarzinii]
MLGNLRIRERVAISLFCTVAVALVWVDALRARDVPPPAVPLLSSGETVVGERIAYPAGAPAKVTAAVVTLAPGQETGWHTHGMPVLGYVLEGELEVDYGEKGVRVYRAGEAVLEAIGVAHNGRNTGVAPMRVLAVFMGADGLKPTEPASR